MIFKKAIECIKNSLENLTFKRIIQMKTKNDYKYVVNGGNSGYVEDDRVYGGQSACIRAIQFRDKLEDKTKTLDERIASETCHKKFFMFSKGTLLELAIAKRERQETGHLVYEDLKLVHEIDAESCISTSRDLEYGFDPDTEIYEEEWNFINTKCYKADKDGVLTIHRNIPKITKDYQPIIEHKGVNSGNRARDVMIENGLWDENYMYQLCKYMVYADNPNGILMYTLAFTPTPFTKNKVKYNLKELNSKCYFVSIKPDSDFIHVGETIDTMSPTEISIQGLHRHTLLALEWLKKDELYPHRPEYKFSDKMGCLYCEHQNICGMYDNHELNSLQDCIDEIQKNNKRKYLIQNARIKKFDLKKRK